MVIKNKVVVGFLDGRNLKGVTWDFVPGKKSFHVADAVDERKVTEVATSDLKAVFFVKSFAGDAAYKSVPAPLEKSPGRALKVTFRDGEILRGTTNAYTPGREAFFMVPADKDDNNERVYVLAHATTKVEVLAAGSGVPAVPSGARR